MGFRVFLSGNSWAQSASQIPSRGLGFIGLRIYRVRQRSWHPGNVHRKQSVPFSKGAVPWPLTGYLFVAFQTPFQAPNLVFQASIPGPAPALKYRTKCLARYSRTYLLKPSFGRSLHFAQIDFWLLGSL